LVGRGVTTRFVDQTDGTEVWVYVACGPTDSIVAHTPTVCYQANGYTWVGPDLRVRPPGDGQTDEFVVSNFSFAQATVPTHLRVFWAYSDGGGWTAPENPRRAFRHTPVLFKCYAIRRPVTPDEPIDGDACLRLMSVLLPRINEAVGRGP
jgi:hypothetical protein